MRTYNEKRHLIILCFSLVPGVLKQTRILSNRVRRLAQRVEKDPAICQTSGPARRPLLAANATCRNILGQVSGRPALLLESSPHRPPEAATWCQSDGPVPK